MSHEIRTPLNAIVGFSSLLTSTIEASEEQKTYISIIQTNSDLLLQLINDVLDISRIESGKLEYKPVPADLRDIINTVSSIARGYTDWRMLNFCGSREELKTPYVMADELRIREVLLNIISNAVKFTKDGGTISFVAENCPGNDEHHVIVRYRISDTGIGMSEEFQSRIFDEFTQENDGARTSYKGTGLGMAIARKLVEKMGGTITFESEKGVGTTFVIRVPFKIDPDADKREEQKDVSEKSIKGLHILLAEDNELNMEIAEFMLQNEGAYVTKAWNGQEAVEIFEKSKPDEFDVILMDIMMPVMNGYEATKMIRSLDRKDAKKISIIAMTANAFIEDRIRAKEAGMDEHLSKPIVIDEVIRTILRCVHFDKEFKNTYSERSVDSCSEVTGK